MDLLKLSLIPNSKRNVQHLRINIISTIVILESFLKMTYLHGFLFISIFPLKCHNFFLCIAQVRLFGKVEAGNLYLLRSWVKKSSCAKFQVSSTSLAFIFLIFPFPDLSHRQPLLHLFKSFRRMELLIIFQCVVLKRTCDQKILLMYVISNKHWFLDHFIYIMLFFVIENYIQYTMAEFKGSSYGKQTRQSNSDSVVHSGQSGVYQTQTYFFIEFYEGGSLLPSNSVCGISRILYLWIS